MMAVRMIYGQHAGQILQVTAARAAELCNGPVQQAEPVAMRRASGRETRTTERETR
jgi:hypothetical protein